MKSKVNVKSSYSIKKVKRVLRMASEGFEPINYEVYKVSGPNKVSKLFTTKKDATAFVKKVTDTKIDIVNVFTELKRIDSMGRTFLEPKYR